MSTLPFDYDDPEVPKACREILRWMMGAADEREGKRTAVAMMMAVIGDDSLPDAPQDARGRP